MKVFMSWSGDKSKAIAEKLRDWLPTIVQSVEPWMSSQDIPAGGRGMLAMANELEVGSFGVLCLTQENKQAPWINFEAGALSKVIDTSKVVPFLVNLKISDVTGPLTQFQAVNACDKDDVFRMIKAIAAASGPRPVPEDRLHKIFDALWPELEAKINELRNNTTGHEQGEENHRSERDILEELLTLTRNADRRLTQFASTEQVINVYGHTAPEPSIRGQASKLSAGDLPFPERANLVLKLLERLAALNGMTIGDVDIRKNIILINLHAATQETVPEVNLQQMYAQVHLLARRFNVPILVDGLPESELFVGE